MEEAVSSVTSSTVESGGAELEQTFVAMAKLGIVSEKTDVEQGLFPMNGDLTVVTDSSTTVTKDFNESPNNLTQSEVSGSSVSLNAEGNTSNMDETSDKSGDSDVTSKSTSVDEACVLEKIENEILEILDSDSISAAEEPIQSEVMNGAVTASCKDTAGDALVSESVLSTAVRTGESWGDSPVLTASSSVDDTTGDASVSKSVPRATVKTAESWGDSPEMEESNSSKSTSVNEACAFGSIENDTVKILNKKPIERTPKERRRINENIKEKFSQSKIIGKKFCVERKIPFPNHKTLHSIVSDLYRRQQLDEQHLEIALEKAAQNRRNNSKSSSTLVEADTSSSSSEAGQIISDEMKAKFKEYSDFAQNYCKSKQIAMPNAKWFNQMLRELASKQQLNEESCKVALEEHGRLKQSRKYASVQKKDNQLPIVAKPVKEMSDEERTAFFKEFRSLQVAVKPVAIKHCHTLKAPFPKQQVFYRMCRNLYQVGMLDEENVKIGIEKAFEEMVNKGGPLFDDELSLILKHYCADNGIVDISSGKVKKEILPKVPKKLLTRKHYWSLMYEERLTNLFRDKSLSHPEAVKLSAKDSNIASSIVQKNSATSSDKKSGSNSKHTNLPKPPRAVEESQTQRKRVWVRTKDGNLGTLHPMGLPWSWCNDNRSGVMTENNRDKFAPNHSKASSSGTIRDANTRNPSNPSGCGTTHNKNTRDRSARNPPKAFSSGAQNGALSERNAISIMKPPSRRIHENSGLLGDLESHVRNVIESYSWPTENTRQPQLLNYSSYDRSQMCFGNKQERWGKSRNPQPHPRAEGLSNYYNNGERPYPGFPPVPIFPSARNYFPDHNFRAQYPIVSNTNPHRILSGASSIPGENVKVAIVHEDYPRRRVTSKEAQLIRNALLDRIGGPGSMGPRFCDTYEERGAVIFECENRMTANWVWANAFTIVPWRNAKLRPNVWEKPPKVICIDVPKVLQDLSVPAICKRLASQNPGLSTEHWKLKADTTSSNSWQLVFNIDNGSMEVLKSLELRPYLGFSRVNVYVNQE